MTRLIGDSCGSDSAPYLTWISHHSGPKPAEPQRLGVGEVGLGGWLGEGGLAVGVEARAIVLVGILLWMGEGTHTAELPDAGWYVPDEVYLDGREQ